MADFYLNPALSYSGVGPLLRQQSILRALGQHGLTPSQLDTYAQAAIREMYQPAMNRAIRMYELAQADKRAQEQLGLQREELGFKKEQAEQAAKASTLSAVAGLAGTAGLGYLGYKALKPEFIPLSSNVTALPSTSSFVSSALTPVALTARDLSGMGAYTSASMFPKLGALGGEQFAVKASLGPLGTTAGTAGTAGTTAGTATSALSSLTSSPYFIPGVGGALRIGIGLATGEEPKKAISSGVGTAVGAYIGQAIAPVPGIGAIVGGAIGNFVGNLFGCIIISAIHGRDSEEVDIARRFRDSFLDLPTLRGYYFLADRVVPLMELDPNFKQHVKQTLVDRLIRFGRAFFAKKQADNIDTNTTINFLTLCRCLGLQMTSYHRLNGEVI